MFAKKRGGKSFLKICYTILSIRGIINWWP